MILRWRFINLALNIYHALITTSSIPSLTHSLISHPRLAIPIAGTQAPLLRLQERMSTTIPITLNSPVRTIEYDTSTDTSTDGSGQYVVTSEGIVARAKYMIVTGSPAAVSTIEFSPPMDAPSTQLLQRMPMGTSMKYMVSILQNFSNSTWLCTILTLSSSEHTRSHICYSSTSWTQDPSELTMPRPLLLLTSFFPCLSLSRARARACVLPP